LINKSEYPQRSLNSAHPCPRNAANIAKKPFGKKVSSLIVARRNLGADRYRNHSKSRSPENRSSWRPASLFLWNGLFHSPRLDYSAIFHVGALTVEPLSGIMTNASTCLRMLNADPPNVDGARLRALFAKKSATTEPVDLNEAT